MMNDRNQSIQDYKIFLNMLDKYEELNLNEYVEGDSSRMVFANQESGEISIKEQVSMVCDSLRNPYFNIYHWAKGELFDIEAINNQLSTRDQIYQKIGKNEKKKKQN